MLKGNEKMKSGRVAFVLVLIVALLVTMTPLMSFAYEPGSQEQVGKYVNLKKAIRSDGSAKQNIHARGVFTEPLVKKNHEGAGAGDLYVNLSKSIVQTGEDKFDIKLDVETNENVKEINIPSNVVIVMDLSGSMDSVPSGMSQIRWLTFRDAMKTFIKSFLEDNPNNQVTLWGFSGISSPTQSNYTNNVHKQICGWTSDVDTILSTFSTQPTASSMRNSCGLGSNQATNGQAMFQAAVDVLGSASTDADRYTSVILVTDGVFNRSYDHLVTSSGETLNPTDQPTVDGDAIAESAKVKAFKGSKFKDLDVYTVGINVASDPINPSVNKGNIDHFFKASDSDMDVIFGALHKKIQGSVQCWTVTDPMSDYVKFKGVKSGNESVIDYSGGTIEWDLLRDLECKVKTVDGNTIYNYSMTYSVEIDKDAVNDANLWEKYFPTNKDTTLYYAVKRNNDELEYHTAHFKIPTVIAVKPLGSLSLKKMDSVSEKNIAGAEFTLYKYNDETKEFEICMQNGEPVVIETGDDGIASIGDLEWGIYKLVETKTPDGYIENTLVFGGDTDEFIVNYENLNIEMTAFNDRYGEVILTKYGESENELLDGAVFYLENEAGDKVYFEGIGGGKYIAKDLLWDTYQLIEEKAAPGYDKGSFVYKDADGNAMESITIGSGEVASLNWEIDGFNKKLPGDLTIKKMDVLNHDKNLVGAEFAIEKYNEETKAFEPYFINGEPATLTTGADGIGTIDGIEWGTYRVIETKAPNGYNKDSLSFDVGVDGIFTVGVIEGQASINIYLDAYNGAVLGEIVDPGDGGGGNVLGETANDPPFKQKVLGEEAKTSDSMNMMFMFYIIIAAFMILVGVKAQQRIREERL